MNDHELEATFTGIYQTIDAELHPPVCRFCGSIFTDDEQLLIRDGENHTFLLTGTPDLRSRAHDCRSVAPMAA
jgi:hypothetical protein